MAFPSGLLLPCCHLAALLCTVTLVPPVLSFTPVSRSLYSFATLPTAALLPRPVVFSDARVRVSISVSAEVEVEEPEAKRVIKRERHTLFVGNLPFETSDAELRELFSQSGSVQLVSIPVNKETGQARGFAFVDMGSKEEVLAAIETVGGSQFRGRTLRVTESLPKDQTRKPEKKNRTGGASNSVDPSATKLYVGNLSYDETRDAVEELFSNYGSVQDVYFPLNKETGDHRGFAFVTLDAESAERAIKETNGLEFNGRPLVVSLPLPPGEKGARRSREPRQKLYIGNLSFYTVPETLREVFGEFGEVHDCYMPEDLETGGSRGFGFVTLDKEAAEAAVIATNGLELDGRVICVNIAQPKEFEDS